MIFVNVGYEFIEFSFLCIEGEYFLLFDCVQLIGMLDGEGGQVKVDGSVFVQVQVYILQVFVNWFLYLFLVIYLLVVNEWIKCNEWGECV